MKNLFLPLTKPIFIASDHGGFETKAKVIQYFDELDFNDLGPNDQNSVNYPDFAHKLCKEITPNNEVIDKSINPKLMGILICGSGQGMAMTANKYKSLRAALCWSEESAQLARSHNNAQVLCLGARLVDENLIYKIIKTFFTTTFDGGRHLNRINLI